VSGCGCHVHPLECRVDARRTRLLGHADWNGIDYVDVQDDQRALCVHLFGRIPELTVDHVRICGGRRIRDIRVVGVEIHRAEEPDFDDCLHLTLDRAGDFSTYCLCLGEATRSRVDACGHPVDATESGWQPLPGFDPRYSCVEFTFKAGCPTPYDCVAEQDCPPASAEPPAIDYLAKDYASFKRLILDRLAVTVPEWRERHVPDVGVAIVELLAYVADRLSYYQDAVATEAYLRTARRRISVRRHARLVDYQMHEGCNARAWITLSSAVDGPLDLARIAFATRPSALTGSNLVERSDLAQLPAAAYVLFEPLTPAPSAAYQVVADQSEIRFYTWGNRECCLPRGATRATLVDTPAEDRTALGLRVGDVLIFEEVLGPTTGMPADADPTHRHAVRLTSVRPARDRLIPRRASDTSDGDRAHTAVIEIEWHPQDALPFALCLSSRTRDCKDVDDVSVARGNVLLVDHGRTVTDSTHWHVDSTIDHVSCGCGPDSLPERVRTPDRLAIALSRSPVTFRQPYAVAPASLALAQEPRQAMPSIRLTSAADAPAGDDLTTSHRTPRPAQAWEPRLDLLGSDEDDRHFVVEVDDDQIAHLRFGDGLHGRQPEAGTSFAAVYRVGNGLAGNVGADSIVCIVADGTPLAGLTVRNPLPASGGVDPEPVDEVKLFAPGAIRRRSARAVIPEDYAAHARLDAAVQSVAPSLAWTGSWFEVDVAVDPFGAESASEELRARVRARLDAVRRVGHDVAVPAARVVPIDVTLSVCVEDDHLAAHVRAAVRDRLGSRALRDGSLGFFHPDRLRFGQDIYVSQLVAEAQRVDGVRHVEVTRLERFPGDPDAPNSTALLSGVLEMRPTEIAVVADDPSFPEHGTLTLNMRGGR
jgi:hypothetical protein